MLKILLYIVFQNKHFISLISGCLGVYLGVQIKM
jgi:hypothetical protein